jgi:hypothetical protein
MKSVTFSEQCIYQEVRSTGRVVTENRICLYGYFIANLGCKCVSLPSVVIGNISMQVVSVWGPVEGFLFFVGYLTVLTVTHRSLVS